MNALINFAHTNTTIKAAVTKLFEVKHTAPNTFRLSVETPDDVQDEGAGQYRVEAPIVVSLLDTAYAEIVSAVTRTTRKDAQIALNDRHRSMSGWDDQYDGAEPDESEDDLATKVVEAVERAEVVLRYGKHIAAIKAGGAEWLAGFEVNKWVPAPGLQDCPEGKFTLEEVMKACIAETGLYDHIKQGRVCKVISVVENRLMSFNDWCDAQIHRKGVADSWRNKCAEARTCDIHLSDIPVNTAIEYIGDIVLASAFNRNTTRLEDAVEKVANNNYLRIAYALQNNAVATEVNKREIDNAIKKAWSFIGYSTMLKRDIAEVKASEEWEDHQLDIDVQAAEVEAKRDERQAYRELAMFNIEKRAVAIAETRTKADEIRALIAKQRSELLNPVKAAPKAKKPAAPKAKKPAAPKAKKPAAKAKKPAAKAKKPTVGIHKVSTMPVLNVKGPRAA